MKKKYNKMEAMETEPSFSKLPMDYIFNGTKDASWNLKKVAEYNEKYEKERKQLIQEKEKLRKSVMEDIYRRIQYDSDIELTRDAAETIWRYVWKGAGRSGFSVALLFWKK